MPYRGEFRTMVAVGIEAPASLRLSLEFTPHVRQVAPITPVIATHLGPGAWGIAYMVED